MQEAVLVLQRPDRADRKRSLDVRDRMVGDATVSHLPLVDQALDLRPRILDRRCAVDIVELEKLDALALQATEARLHIRADRLRAEIYSIAAFVVGQRAALGQHEHVLAAAQRAPGDLLRATPAVERR